jgi:hypothetical protein
MPTSKTFENSLQETNSGNSFNKYLLEDETFSILLNLHFLEFLLVMKEEYK